MWRMSKGTDAKDCSVPLSGLFGVSMFIVKIPSHHRPAAAAPILPRVG
jgi:hypothetical protein